MSRIAVFLAAAVCLQASCFAQTEITRTVIATGGGISTSATMSLRFTVGEPAVGGVSTVASSVPPIELRAGFWHAPDGMSQACYPDCDLSGSLDFFDFLCFQNEFATGQSYADCDMSGTLDFFDFLCFQNAFAAGCP